VICTLSGGARNSPAAIAAHRRHYTGHVADTDVVLTREGDEPQPAVLFAHRDFPGLRFGHWFPPDDVGTEEIGLEEAIETGALDRLMAGPARARRRRRCLDEWDDES
jgi:hypothetical protein